MHLYYDPRGQISRECGGGIALGDRDRTVAREPGEGGDDFDGLLSCLLGVERHEFVVSCEASLGDCTSPNLLQSTLRRLGRVLIDTLAHYGVLTAATQHDPDRPEPRAVVLARSDLLGTAADPVYRDRLGATWEWLNEIAVEGVVDVGIDALPPMLDQLGDRTLTMVADAPPAPVLLPAYLDQWTQTNPRPHADPDVSLFLHGIPVDSRSVTADVRVVWRADLTEELLQQSDRLLGEYLAATPPASAEAISLPVWTVKQWLAGEKDSGNADFADVEGVAPETGDEVSPERRVLVWRGREESRNVAASAIQPGDTIVVPVTYGGIGRHGTFDPGAVASERVRIADLGDIVQLRQRGKASLRLNALMLESLLGEAFDIALPITEDVEADQRSALRDVVEVIKGVAETRAAPSWLRTELLPALGDEPRFIRSSLARLGVEYATWIAIARPNTATVPSHGRTDVSIPAAVDEDDESFTGDSSPGTLSGHLGGVSSLAVGFASRVRLPHVVLVSLKWAGLLHDVGKADPRFQVLLYGGDEIAARFGDLLAKSDIPYQDAVRRRLAREIARYPRGQRHELVSAAMIERSDELRNRIETDRGDWDLVLHLVATHHGWGRALAPVLDADDLDDPVEMTVDGLTLSGNTRHGRDRLDSGHTERFWQLTRTYGHHELAYYEAILRLADHRYSAAEEMR